MSSSHPNGGDSPSPLASPRDPPRLDTSTPHRPRPRPKLVSFGRDSLLGGRPDTEGAPHVEFIRDRSPEIIPTRMSSEVDPLLKEVMSPSDEDDDWMGENHVEETKSSWFLFLLTFGGLGLQIGWSVETSNGSVSHITLTTEWTLIPDTSSSCSATPHLSI
jgi:solute carrier family 45 protein 1/2/4